MQIINVLTNVKIRPQISPSLQTLDQLNAERGFPDAKKYLLFQLVKLFSYNKYYHEMIKLIKYLLNSITKELTDEELTYHFNILETLSSSKSR